MQDDRHGRGTNGSGGKTTVLAEHRPGIGRCHAINARIDFQHDVAHVVLVASVDIGIDERDGDRLDLGHLDFLRR